MFWKEVYSGFSQAEYMRIKEVLSNNHIKYKVKVNSAQNRIARDLTLGGNPAALNSAGMKTVGLEYKIVVKKRFLEQANFLISK